MPDLFAKNLQKGEVLTLGLISPSLIIFASVTAANYALNDTHCTSGTVSVVCL